MMARMIVILTGVTGSGKTTVGRLLAARMGLEFLDADDYHPPANVEKMRRGEPLTDADRAPWLEALRGLLLARRAEGRGVALACSALPTPYHERLAVDDSVRLVHLKARRELIARRLAERRGHFMNPRLLESQFEALEAPERGLTVNAEATPEEIVETIVEWLGAGKG
jgi:gluconokinase